MFGGPAKPGNDDLQQGVLDLALAVPNVSAEICDATAHARIGWLRSVYNIFHAFAIGSFVDEIAEAKKADPRDIWLELIGPPRKMSLADLGVEKLPNYGQPLEQHPVDAGRLRNVIERVTEAAGWRGRANGRPRARPRRAPELPQLHGGRRLGRQARERDVRRRRGVDRRSTPARSSTAIASEPSSKAR